MGHKENQYPERHVKFFQMSETLPGQSSYYYYSKYNDKL